MVTADITAIKIGDEASCEVTFADADVAAFAALSGDVNPLHLSEQDAGDLGFARRVAHGMLSMSILSRLIGTELPGGGSLWMSHDIQFAQPVFVGDRVRAMVVVEQISIAIGVVKLRAEVNNLTTGSVVLRGSARVKVPPRRSTTVTHVSNEPQH